MNKKFAEKLKQLTEAEKARKEFAEKINPRTLGFSPKMTAVVGAILGYDYGVRDRKGGYLTGLCITSDGFVTASSTASDGGGAFLGVVTDLDRNIEQFLFVLASERDEADVDTFKALYKANVTDWRQ
jgi:hypothetical protein